MVQQDPVPSPVHTGAEQIKELPRIFVFTSHIASQNFLIRLNTQFNLFNLPAVPEVMLNSQKLMFPRTYYLNLCKVWIKSEEG